MHVTSTELADNRTNVISFESGHVDGRASVSNLKNKDQWKRVYVKTSFLAHGFPGYVLRGESVDPILHDVNNDGYFRAALFSIKKKETIYFRVYLFLIERSRLKRFVSWYEFRVFVVCGFFHDNDGTENNICEIRKNYRSCLCKRETFLFHIGKMLLLLNNDFLFVTL